MKRMIRILILALTLVTGITTVSAQRPTVQVLLIPKVASLPVTVTSYLEDPLHYFHVQFIVTNAGSEGIDVFYDMSLTVNTSPFYVRTIRGTVPPMPIRLSEGVNKMNSLELHPQLLNRTETNVDYSHPFQAQQLPEGIYELCLDFYLWSDKDDPNRIPITIGPCPTFEICYSGSAPELVSPMAGAQQALNGALVVTPNRKVNFIWTPVISNCSNKNNRFKYKLKVVKVMNGQNYQDAIRYNPTVFSTEVRNNTFAIFDTLRDIKVQLEQGALYVAQVQAEKVNSNMRAGGEDAFIIANNGNSQPMPFYWGFSNNALNPYLGMDPLNNPNGTFGDPNDPTNSSRRRYGVSVDDESEEGESEGVDGLTKWKGGVVEVSELETIIEELKEQYLAGFIQDAATVATLTEAYPEELEYVPTPKRLYVESDGYYTVPMTDDLEVSFMPMRHESLKDVSYTLSLYDYLDNDLDSTTAYEPLFVEDIEVPESYSKMDSHELVSRTLEGWGSELEQGSLYYLQLKGYFAVDYWEYSIADTSFYVNQKLAEHFYDTISREYFEDEALSLSNGVIFQWGEDPETSVFKTPQWKFPVNRTDDDIYDPENHKIPATVPEVQKDKTFPVSWTPVRNVTPGDEVEYEVNVYELKKGQTLAEALSENEVLVSRTITDANGITIQDTDFFKVFSNKKTYVMTLTTNVYGESDTFYHFENGNQALPAIFKIVK